jgi:hypothetical protein
MSRLLRGAAGAGLAVVSAVLLAALSQRPYTPPAAADAMLRLSWRVPGERVQECRRLSEEERERLPAHMRRDEVCEGRLLPSVLVVEVDGRTVVHDTVRGSGARGDRPLSVFRELALPPGAHAVRVRFERAERADGDDHDDGDEHEDRRQHEDRLDPGTRRHTPARLSLDGRLEISAGEVALVTYDPDRRALVVRTPSPSAPAPR